jgi:hypothetical protein
MKERAQGREVTHIRFEAAAHWSSQSRAPALGCELKKVRHARGYDSPNNSLAWTCRADHRGVRRVPARLRGRAAARGGVGVPHGVPHRRHDGGRARGGGGNGDRGAPRRCVRASPAHAPAVETRSLSCIMLAYDASTHHHAWRDEPPLEAHTLARAVVDLAARRRRRRGRATRRRWSPRTRRAPPQRATAQRGRRSFRAGSRDSVRPACMDGSREFSVLNLLD